MPERNLRRFDYHAHDYRIAPKLGLIVLQADEVIENEIRHWLPPGTELFHSRVPSGRDVSRESLAAMEAEIGPATSLLPTSAEIDAVAYCCTSGTCVIGEERVTEIIRTELPGVSVTNPLTAVKANLQAVGAREIAVLTPYVPEVSEALASHLEGVGFRLSALGSFYEAEEAKVTRIAPQSILDAVVAMGEKPGCDAVFLSCTNLRTLTLLEKAKHLIGKPVISSNSALAFHLTRLADQACVSK